MHANTHTHNIHTHMHAYTHTHITYIHTYIHGKEWEEETKKKGHYLKISFLVPNSPFSCLALCFRVSPVLGVTALWFFFSKRRLTDSLSAVCLPLTLFRFCVCWEGSSSFYCQGFSSLFWSSLVFGFFTFLFLSFCCFLGFLHFFPFCTSFSRSLDLSVVSDFLHFFLIFLRFLVFLGSWYPCVCISLFFSVPSVISLLLFLS